jgi:fucose 4-O-acetylase-like acetyltransferase
VENAPGAREPDRDRYVDFLRVVAIGFVVFGHWLVTSVVYVGGAFQAADVLRDVRWAPWVTWGFQVMPVFFLVGGFAAAISWRRADGRVSRWTGQRTLRLLIPTTWYVAAALAAAAIAIAAGVSAANLSLAGWAVALHLWFLPVYLVLTLLTPALHAAHRRWGLAVPVAMAITGVAIDVLVITTHVKALGWLNYVLVWGAAYQLGFSWQDGTLTRARRLPWSIAAVGAVTFIALEWSGAFPVSLIGKAGQQINNTAPPSVALLAYAAAQLGTLIAIAPRVSAWLLRPRLWRVVNACNKEVMTVYLWQMFPVVAAGVLLYPTGAMPQPSPGTAEWWFTRPLWMATVAAIMVPLVLATRGPRRPQPHPRPQHPTRTAGITRTAGGNPLVLAAAIVLTSIALARFAIAGFAPDGRLPIAAIAIYSTGLLLLGANALLSRRRLSPAPTAPRPAVPTHQGP